MNRREYLRVATQYYTPEAQKEINRDNNLFGHF